MFEIRVEGERQYGVAAKDIILGIIGHIGTAGATGTVVEYCGEAIEALSMEERMTVCNMSIEGRGKSRNDSTGPKNLRVREGSPVRAEKTAITKKPSSTGKRSARTPTPFLTNQSVLTPAR